MKAKHYVVIFLAVLLVGYFQGVGQAAIYGVSLNVFTQNRPDPTEQRMFFFVKVSDTKGVRGPDALSALTVKAPDGSVFDLLALNCWEEWNDQFEAKFPASAFVSGIPTGTYTLTAVDKTGTPTLKNTDTFTFTGAATFIGVPTISAPVGAIATLTPTVKWNAIAGAQCYRLTLLDNTKDMPIYLYPYKKIFVSTPLASFTIPTGVLKNSSTYRVRVEAFDNDKNENRRGRSDWVTFTTP